MRSKYLVLIAATVVAIAWGVLAFGAVYRWAYVPLGIGCAVIGVLGLLVARGSRPPLTALAVSFAILIAAVGVQLIPLPAATLASVSPHAPDLREQFTASYGVIAVPNVDATAAPADKRPISIEPNHTITGLFLLAAFALFFLGTARLLSRTGGIAIARPIIVLGVALAIFGIGQDALTVNDKHPLIYGFWKPQFDARGFGPFVNPNHFAGWMLMAAPLAVGLFFEAFQRVAEAAAASSRNRISITRVPEFGLAVTYGFAALVMALAVAMTRSRSGLAALAAGMLVAAWMMVRHQRSTLARGIVIVSAVALLAGSVAWAGLDTVLEKALNTDANGNSLEVRKAAWRDTIRIAHDFPWTGSGLNTFGTAMTVYQTENRIVHFQEAHNDYLQLMAEGGVLLGTPILIAIVVFVRTIWKRFVEAPKVGTTYWLRVGAVIGLISIALQSMVEFSLQMPGNAALFALLAAMAIHQSPNLRSGTSSRSREQAHADQRSGSTVGAI